MKEPLNLKLLLLFLLKKLWLLLCATLLFAALFGGIYYLKNYVFAPAPEYEAVSQLYLTYADDVRLENVYINDYTWQTLADSDICVEEAKKNLSFDCSDDYLREAATAGLESDVRLVTVTAVAESPERAVEIANAYEKAIQLLGERMVDVDEVQIFTSASSAIKKEWDNRTLRMSITGGVVGFVAGLVILLFVFAADDSVYLPETTKIRYHFPTLACFDKAGNPIGKWQEKSAEMNFETVLNGKSRVYISDISGSSGSGTEFADSLKAKLGDAAAGLIPADDIRNHPETVKEMKDADGIIVLIKAGAGNGKQIEEVLGFLEVQEIKVLGAVLYNVDKKTLLCYQKPVRV